jgi:hypothetical protein
MTEQVKKLEAFFKWKEVILEDEDGNNYSFGEY